MTAPGRFDVVHLTTFLQGGAGRAIVDLAIGQRAAGRGVAVVTSRTGVPGADNYPEYLARLEAARVPVVSADSAFSRDLVQNLAMVRAIRAALPIDRVRVVHAHAATPALIGLILAGTAGRLLPVVQTMHGWGVNKTAEQAARDLAIMREVARVVVTSEASGADLVARGLPIERVVTIPCGIDRDPPPGPLPATAEFVARARRQGAAVIACVGSVTESKNQRLLIDALPDMAARRPAVALFVGEGPLIPELEAQARSLGVGNAVSFAGYQPHASRVLADADVLVLPSRAEGQGLAVLEAFRARVPVVASDIPALRELVRDGETGYLCACDDRASLADAVGRALDQSPDRRERIVAQAHQAFLNRYTLDSMLAAHDGLYAGLRV